MKFQIGAMSLGDILDRGLKLLAARFGTLFTIQFLLFLPLLLVQFGVVLSSGQPNPVVVAAMGVLLLVLLLVLQPIASGAVLKVVADEYVDRKVSTGGAIGFAMTRFAPLLGTSILAGLVVFVGLLLLIIPGILWSLSYAFVGQVVVLERLSGTAAMARSSALAAGHRGRIFGLLLLIGVINLLLGLAAGALELALPSYQYRQTPYGLVPESVIVGNAALNIFVAFMVNVLMTSYAAICTTLIYFDLRVRKEGFDLEVAAQGTGGPAEPR